MDIAPIIMVAAFAGVMGYSIGRSVGFAAGGDDARKSMRRKAELDAMSPEEARAHMTELQMRQDARDIGEL